MHGAKRLEIGINSESQAAQEHVLEMDEAAAAGEVAGKNCGLKGQRWQSSKQK